MIKQQTMKQYLFRVWAEDKRDFSYYVWAGDKITAKWKVMCCLDGRNEPSTKRFYGAEVVRELVNGNGITTTQLPIARVMSINIPEYEPKEI